MPENDKNKYERLSRLIQGVLTRNLTEDEFQVLDQMMSDDPECLKYYIEYTTIWALLDETECLANTDNTPDFNTMMEKVREEHKSTPKTQMKFLLKYEQEKRSYLFSKWKQISILLSAAAVF